MRTDFCMAGVIQALVLNFILYLFNFLSGACLLKSSFMFIKKLFNDKLISFLLRFKMPSHSLLNLDQFMSYKFDLEEGGSEKINETKRNCGKWSEIIDVKLPEVASLLYR